MTRRILARPVILPALIIAAIVIAIIIVKTRPALEHVDQSMQPCKVRVIHANTIPVRIKSVGYGTVEPAVALAAKAQVSGKISYIHAGLEQGGSLSEGTVVIRIEPVDYELSLTESEAALRSSKSSLQQLEIEEKSTRKSLQLARKNLEVGEAELERKRKIHADKLIAKTLVDAEEQKVITLRQTVEDLHGRYRIAIRIVGVRLQSEACVSEVGRIHLATHLEPLAVIGFPHVTEQGRHGQQGAVRYRAADQSRATEPMEPGKPVAARRRIAADTAEAGHGDPHRGIPVPGLNIRRQPARLRGPREAGWFPNDLRRRRRPFAGPARRPDPQRPHLPDAA